MRRAIQRVLLSLILVSSALASAAQLSHQVVTKDTFSGKKKIYSPDDKVIAQVGMGNILSGEVILASVTLSFWKSDALVLCVKHFSDAKQYNEAGITSIDLKFANGSTLAFDKPVEGSYQSEQADKKFALRTYYALTPAQLQLFTEQTLTNVRVRFGNGSAVEKQVKEKMAQKLRGDAAVFMIELNKK